MTQYALKLISYMQDMEPTTKGAFDVASFLAVAASWATFAQASLTILSTVAGLVWIGIRIWETETVKTWNAKRKVVR